MGDNQPTAAGARDITDPHQSKIPLDDPRLKIERPRPRTLKRVPAALAVCSVATLMSVSLLAGLTPDKKQKAGEAKPAVGQTFDIPDAIKNAPGNNSPIRPPGSGAPQLGGPLQGNLARTMVPTTDGTPQGGDLARRQERIEQLYRARAAALFFDADEGPAGDTSSSATGQTASAMPGIPAMLAARGAASEGGAAGGQAPEQNMQERKNDFLSRAGANAASYLDQPVTTPRSPYEVKAGTIIPTVLLTGINSDLPGQVIGQVRENVYDSVSGNYLLIPQGSRLLAAYDSMVSFGQERVLVCWNRLIRPDGSSVNLECMPGVDLAGQAGFADDVNHHWWRVLTGVALGSLLAAGTASSQGNITGQPTFAQLWAQGAASGVNQAGQQLTQKNIGLQPTITVRPGFSVNVLVAKDIVVSPVRESQ